MRGFDASVQAEFRSRVVTHGLEQRALDLLLGALVEQGLVAAGGRQRTDSTHVIGVVRDLTGKSQGEKAWHGDPGRWMGSGCRDGQVAEVRATV
jgi:hypothetical protein